MDEDSLLENWRAGILPEDRFVSFEALENAFQEDYVPGNDGNRVVHPTVWTDEECERAVQLVRLYWNPNKPPSQQTAYSEASKVLCVKRTVLIGRLHRYKKRKDL